MREPDGGLAGSEREDARCDCNRAIQNNEFASQVSQSSSESKEESEDVGGDMKDSAVIENFCHYRLIFFVPYHMYFPHINCFPFVVYWNVA